MKITKKKRGNCAVKIRIGNCIFQDQIANSIFTSRLYNSRECFSLCWPPGDLRSHIDVPRRSLLHSLHSDSCKSSSSSPCKSSCCRLPSWPSCSIGSPLAGKELATGSANLEVIFELINSESHCLHSNLEQPLASPSQSFPPLAGLGLVQLRTCLSLCFPWLREGSI